MGGIAVDVDDLMNEEKQLRILPDAVLLLAQNDIGQKQSQSTWESLGVYTSVMVLYPMRCEKGSQISFGSP